MRPWQAPGLTVLGLTALFAAWGLACGPSPPADPEGDSRPLFAPHLVPEVLAEARTLELPSSPGGNRFLKGWWPAVLEGRPVLWPAEVGARLEVVSLGGGPRTLELELAKPAEAAGVLWVDLPNGEASEQDPGESLRLGPFPVESPSDGRLEIPLPTLPLGRNALDLVFESPQGPPAVAAAGLRGSLPAGEAKLEGGDLVQRGHSLAEIVRRVEAGTLVSGRFEGTGSTEARFTVWAEGEGGVELARAALPSAGGTRRVHLDLVDFSGFVRFRFLSRGAGAAGAWRGWTLTTAEDEKTAEEGGRGAEEKVRAGAAKPATIPPPRLVVVSVMDALRADFVGHLGGPEGVSPLLDRLAAEGVTFLDHESTAPNTLPSTKALFTGRTFVVHGGWRLGERPATLAERFREAGYRTAAFSGNEYVGSGFGTDRGFDFVDPSVLFGPGERPFNDNAAQVHAAALDWIESLPPGEKAFVYLHTIHPHNPYDPPEPLRERFAKRSPSGIDGSTRTLLDVKHGRIEPSAADEERLRGLYAGAVAYNDRELGAFLEAAAKLYPREETFLAVTSDHGEELFERGGVLHGYTLHREMLRIPLVLWAPGRLEPGRVEARTTTLDLHATLLDVAGLTGPDAAESEGRSLLALVRGTDPEGFWGEDRAVRFAAASSVKGGIFSASTERWKLVWAPRFSRHWGQGEGRGRSRDGEYLYDLHADPDERVNLAGGGDLEAAWLRSRLQAWVQSGIAQEEGRGAEAELDDEARERLKALGYLD